MPQYAETDVNKPSWVSNVRLIEIGPVKEGNQAPDAQEVPVDEVWIYGNIPTQYALPLLLPILLLLAGIILLIAVAFVYTRGKRAGESISQVVAIIVAAALVLSATPLLSPSRSRCLADPGGRVFSKGELAAMPALSGRGEAEPVARSVRGAGSGAGWLRRVAYPVPGPGHLPGRA
jgi:hypothetical protein